MNLKNYSPGDNPLEEFAKWLKFVTDEGEIEPTAMQLATVSNSQPHIRTVLLKGISQNGFCFFTNYESDKAKQIEMNPVVGLNFHWKKNNLQVRIEGRIEKVTRQESEEYFSSRPRGSQVGAWASKQSHEIVSRDELIHRVRDLESKFGTDPIPCPPFWGGYRVLPTRIEFWVGREDRLHDRFVFTKRYSDWELKRLSP